MQTPQDPTVFPENMNEMLNTMPPNVALQPIKPRLGSHLLDGPSVGSKNTASDTAQLSPKYSLLNIGVSSGGISTQNSLPQSPAGGPPQPTSSQLSPGQRGPPYSPRSVPSSQQSYPSPSSGGPPTPYGQPTSQSSHRMSPHPYSNVPSPAQGQGPNSPAAHLQIASPQPSSTSSPASAPHGWPPPNSGQVPAARTSGIISNRMQQQNPMLNAQLSQGPFTANTAQANIRSGFIGWDKKDATQAPQIQRSSINQRTLTSPGPLHSASRNSPIPQYPSSPGLYQLQQQGSVSSGTGASVSQSPTQGGPQPRLISQAQQSRPQLLTARVNSPRFVTSTESGNMTSPYNFPQPGTTVMENRSVTPTQFAFDNRSLSCSQPASSTVSTVSSEYVRQELRAMVGARTQQQQSQQQQQPSSQSLHPQASASSSQPSNNVQLCASTSSQFLSSVDLEVLGLSFDFNETGTLGNVVNSGSNVNSNCDPEPPLFCSMFDMNNQTTSVTSSMTTTSNPSNTNLIISRTSNFNNSRMVSRDDL